MQGVGREPRADGAEVLDVGGGEGEAAVAASQDADQLAGEDFAIEHDAAHAVHTQ
jgi:ubiquinone/menaquinone biosynthesis C-methylase UbiE